MKPDRAGIWEWFEEDGTKRLVEVFDVAAKLREATGHADPHLRVYWWGGYYNVNEETDCLYDSKGSLLDEVYTMEAEWADRWGNRVGDNNSLPDEQLYLGPTPEQRAEILKQYEDLKKQ